MGAPQLIQRERIVFATEILAYRIDEDLIVPGRMRKEGHGRAELEDIRITEDGFGAAARDLVHETRALTQPRAEKRMAQVSFGFRARGDREALRHRAMAESPDLR